MERRPQPRVLDLGCGAERNAAPIAGLGCRALGTAIEWPRLQAAWRRARVEEVAERAQWALARTDCLPVPDRVFDVIVAHGIFTLAGSSAEFRRAVAEAARAGRPEAGLFLFTFSRQTLPLDAQPVAGEPFVFTSAGFEALGPFVEHNRPRPGQLDRGGPVINEGTFRLRSWHR